MFQKWYVSKGSIHKHGTCVYVCTLCACIGEKKQRNPHTVVELEEVEL